MFISTLKFKIIPKSARRVIKRVFRKLLNRSRLLFAFILPIVLCVTLSLAFAPIASSQSGCNLVELNKFQDKNSNRSLEILKSCRTSLPESIEKAEVLRLLALMSYDRIDSATAIQSGPRPERLNAIESLLKESADLGKNLNNSAMVSNANYSLAQIRSRELDRLLRTPIDTDSSGEIQLQNALDLQSQIETTLEKFRDSETALPSITLLPGSSSKSESEDTIVARRLEQLQPKLYQARLLMEYLPRVYTLVSHQNKVIDQENEQKLSEIEDARKNNLPIPKFEPSLEENEVKKLEQTMVVWTSNLVNLLQAIPTQLQDERPIFISNPDLLALNIYHATTLRKLKSIAEGVYQHETDRQARLERLFLENLKRQEEKSIKSTTNQTTTNPISNKSANPSPDSSIKPTLKPIIKPIAKPAYQPLFPIALQTQVQTLYSSANQDAANLLIKTIANLRNTQAPTPGKPIDPRLKRNEIQAINALASLYEDDKKYDIASSLIDEKTLLNADTLNSPEISGLIYGRAARIQLQKIRNQFSNPASNLNINPNSNPQITPNSDLQKDSRAALGLSETAIKRIELVRGDLVSLSPDLQYNYRDSVEPLYRDNIELQFLQSKPDLKTILERVESLKIAEIHNYFREPCIEAKVELDQFITQKLPNSIALIYTILQNDRLEIITKLPNQDGLRHYQSIVDRGQLNATAQKLKVLIQDNATDDSKAQSAQIYQWIFNAKDTQTQTPLAEGLPENTTLVMVLDGSLREIPINALYDAQRQQYLIDRYAVAISPGLKLFEPQTIQRPSLLFSGQSIFPNASPGEITLRTLNSKDELDRIAPIFQPQKILLDTDLTRYQPLTLDNFRELVARQPFNIVHLSTHAKFSSQQEKTYIAMGDRRVSTDQFSDILRQRNRNRSESIELLVLSACETLTGDDRAALGLSGIAIRSGARSTFASLWTINDKITTEVVVDFYQGLKDNLSKANALRNAQLKLKNQGQGIAQWSPYVIVGNWL